MTPGNPHTREKIERLLNILGVFSRTLGIVGSVALFAMMCLTAADVVGRYFFNKPIVGAFELIEFLVLILIFSFVGYTQHSKSHVTVEIFMAAFPGKVRFWCLMFNHVVCFCLMSLIAWMGAVTAFEMIKTGESSQNLSLPNYPFVFFLSLGCMVLSIEYLRDILRLLTARDAEVLE